MLVYQTRVNILRSVDNSKPVTARQKDPTVDAVIKNVGIRVRAKRREQSMSRRQLSEYSGVSPRYLAQLEAGEGNISIGLLQMVSRALNTSLEALIRDDDPLSEQAANVADLFKNADAKTRARVVQALSPARLREQKSQRICLIGLRGAGKSTLGNLIAKQFGLPFVELNTEIETNAGMPTAEIIALYGQEGYRELEAAALSKIVANQEKVVLAVAGGIVADQVTFDLLLNRFHTVWVKASPSEHMERVRAQGDFRPMAGNPQAMIQLRQILKSREAQYSQAEYSLDTSGKTVSRSCNELKTLVEIQIL